MAKQTLEKVLEKEGITEQEAVAAIRSSRKKPSQMGKVRSPTKHVKYLYFSDPHIGHVKFSEPLFEELVKTAKKEKPDFIINPGDHLEGMSHRPGHVYELTDIGFNQQIKHAADLYNQLSNMDHFGIDGNHDQWYFRPQNAGVVVGDELELRVKNYKNLGQDEGWVELTPGVNIYLFHANDGSAYAQSYKLQKLIESFTGGEKPNIVHSGHYHKALSLFKRNIHGFESATLCGQSKYMRGKKLPADMGFGLVDVWYNKNGIDRLAHEFTPWYEETSEPTKYKKRK